MTGTGAQALPAQPFMGNAVLSLIPDTRLSDDVVYLVVPSTVQYRRT